MVELNHGIVLYPDWSNSSDFIDTPEQFGTVPLHSATLDDTIKNNITIDPTIKFTGDKKYISNRMGVAAPFLPVYGESESKLFCRLILQMAGKFDENRMANEWCNHVDGNKIFPKLPVYLRSYHKTWERNQRVKYAVENAKDEITKLQELNSTLATVPITIETRNNIEVSQISADQNNEGPQRSNMSIHPMILAPKPLQTAPVTHVNQQLSQHLCVGTVNIRNTDGDLFTNVIKKKAW